MKEYEYIKEYVEKQYFINMLETYKKTFLKLDADSKTNIIRMHVANELIDLIESMESSYSPV